MEKEFIKVVKPSKTGFIKTYTVDQIIRVGIKIKEVKAVTPDMTFRELMADKILETSIHIENDNYNINQ